MTAARVQSVVSAWGGAALAFLSFLLLVAVVIPFYASPDLTSPAGGFEAYEAATRYPYAWLSPLQAGRLRIRLGLLFLVSLYALPLITAVSLPVFLRRRSRGDVGQTEYEWWVAAAVLGGLAFALATLRFTQLFVWIAD